MKVRVSRFMRSGVCFIGFQSIDISPEDREKFQKFGTPAVQILMGSGPRIAIPVIISALDAGQTAGFANPEEATAYEQRILNEVKNLYDSIRSKRDEFTSTHEVEL